MGYENFPNNQNDRTKAFNVNKVQRRNDSVSWIIAGVLLFFLNVVSIGRITIVGQFIDDVVFTLPFGWFKYFIYLIFIGLDFCIYFGFKFKFKKRFLAMVFSTWCAFAWIITATIYIVTYKLDIDTIVRPGNYFEHNAFVASINKYLSNWKYYSLWGHYSPQSWILCNTKTYISLWASGGLIGAFFSGIGSYLTIYGNLVLSFIFLFLDCVWIFTGDMFYLFRSKESKINHKRLRILSLTPKSKKIKLNNNNLIQKKSIFQIDMYDSSTSDLDVLNLKNIADLTIEMPGFWKEVRENNAATIDESDEVFAQTTENLDFDYDDNDYNQVKPKANINFQKYLRDEDLNNNPNQFNNWQSNQQEWNNQSFEANSFGYPSNQFNNNPNQIFNNQVNQNQFTQQPNEYPESIYGDISTLDARKKFEQETALTPFGANGKTREILGKGANDLDFANEQIHIEVKKENDNQLTIEEFIDNNSINNKNIVPDYDSPLKKRADKFFMNNGDYGWTNSNINIDSNKKITKIPENKKYYINKNYQLPPIDLLEDESQENIKVANILNVEAQEKTKKINAVFDSFKVKAHVSSFLVGPSVTKYIINLEPGIKVQSILGLENEIKLQLGVQNILMEAPIKNMAAVGIDIPNTRNMMVKLKGAISEAPLQKFNSKLLFPIGKNITGEYIFDELSAMPHLLIAGSTGSGKSVMVNSIIISILMRAKPHEVKMLLIDPKRVELSAYGQIPHLLAPVISDMSLASNALKKVVFEMERRYSLFEQKGVKSIDKYNALMKNEEERLPLYVVVIDELADLMLTENKKNVEESITRLTQMARASGIHLIVATQRPSTDVITGVIKANIPSRIAFAVANQFDSRTILDSNGAERLIGRGDLLFIKPGLQKPNRAQGSYVSEKEIDKITSFCSDQQEPIFDDDLLSNDNGDQTLLGGDDLDPLYEQAIDLIVTSGQASTSYLQRKLRIGYNRASRLIDQLEENGVVGPQNGAKSRDIYVKR